MSTTMISASIATFLNRGADVPARLPEGTFILNARAARALGPALLARIEALGAGWAGDADAVGRIRRAMGKKSPYSRLETRG